MAVLGKPSFTCPNCNALYQLVRVEAGPESVDRQPTCRDCGAPFNGRAGKFVLKYFMLRKAGRAQGERRSAQIRPE
jgi:transposase-like protein